jgi:hypothetical protein
MRPWRALKAPTSSSGSPVHMRARMRVDHSSTRATPSSVRSKIE